MPKANSDLIKALKETSKRLEEGAKYEWGHMGRCNCGHLIQTLTDQTDVEINQYVETEIDEWSEHAKDYCPNSGDNVDAIFDIMYEFGFTNRDMMELEYLTNKEVLNRIGHNTYLKRNNRQDVVLYMNTMADMLEEDLVLV